MQNIRIYFINSTVCSSLWRGIPRTGWNTEYLFIYNFLNAPKQSSYTDKCLGMKRNWKYTDHLAVIGLIHHDISVHAKPTHFHFTQSQEGIEFIPWKHLFCYYKYSCYWMINLIFQEKLLIPINNHMLYVFWEERARSINRKKSDSKFEDRNNWFWCNCFPGSCAGLLKSRLHESSLQIAQE